VIKVLDTSCHPRVRTWVQPKYGKGYYSMSWREQSAAARLYVHADQADDGYSGAFTQMEHLLFDRWTNPVAMYKQFLPAIFEALGLPSTTKARWSQKAGCSCGCSPAFILQGPGLSGKDYWATLGDPVAVAKATVWREQGKSVRARREAKALITNANRAFAEGVPVVRIKELATYASKDPRPGDWQQKSY
jgi:hypothetical protein